MKTLVHNISFLLQSGNSALTLAVSRGYTDGVMELIKAGANLDLQKNVGNLVFPPYFNPDSTLKQQIFYIKIVDVKIIRSECQ